MAHDRGSPGVHSTDRFGADDTARSPSPLPDPAEPADADLVAAAIHDPLAFAPLYRRYVTPIYRYCYRHTSDPELAADLTTQIFTSAIEALPNFRQRVGQRVGHHESAGSTGSSFRGWLFTIAHNAVIDHRRRARPSRPLDDTHHRVADNERGPEDRAVLRDELDRLIAVLDRIPGGQRQIIELRLAGLTTAEIATTLSMSRAAVKSAQTRAYARLRDLLDPPSAQQPTRTTSPQEPSHDRA